MNKPTPDFLGVMPEKPGFYWYIPEETKAPSKMSAARERLRKICICEVREGAKKLFFTNGSQQLWVLAGDQFFGPLVSPLQCFTVYWRTGKRELVWGADRASALTSAGYGNGATGAIDFIAEGENGDYVWRDGDWRRTPASTAERIRSM